MRLRDVRSLLAGSGLALVGGLLVACGSAAEPTETWQAAPPEGTRWVGYEQVVVAVPEWWTTGETQCLAPVEDTVYFDNAAVADCDDPADPRTVREVSALAVLDATGGYGELVTRDMRPIGEVAGHEVFEREGCEEWFPGVCRRMFAVPSKGVVFAVTIAEAGDGSYAEIRDSLAILPDDQTTVPLATSHGWTPTWGAEPPVVEALRRTLERAGLRVEVVTAEPPDEDAAGMVADVPTGSLLEVSPGLGSVVHVGATVTLTVA